MKKGYIIFSFFFLLTLNIYGCAATNKDSVSKSRQERATVEQQKTSDKSLASGKSGTYYLEFPAEEYRGILFFNKYGNLITSLIKEGTGLMAPVYSVKDDYTIVPDWDKSAHLHEWLTDKLGLKLLPLKSTEEFYQIFKKAPINDAALEFAEEAQYLIVPDSAISKLSKKKSSIDILNLYVDISGRSDITFIPFRTFREMSNVLFETQSSHASFCGVDNIPYGQNINETAAPLYKEYYATQAALFKECLNRAQSPEEKGVCSEKNKTGSFISEEQLKTNLSKLTPSLAEKIRQKEKMDYAKLVFCQNIFKRLDIGGNAALIKTEKESVDDAIAGSPHKDESVGTVREGDGTNKQDSAADKSSRIEIAAGIEQSRDDQSVKKTDKTANREAAVAEKDKSENKFAGVDSTTKRKPSANIKNIRVKVLCGDGNMDSAFSMMKEIEKKGYKVESVNRAERSNFKSNIIYYAPDYHKEASKLAIELGGNAICKPLSWPSAFHLIVVTGR